MPASRPDRTIMRRGREHNESASRVSVVPGLSRDRWHTTTSKGA